MSRTIKRVACTGCKRRNDPWRSFCGGCGCALVGACKACGAVNGIDDKFCGGCAKALKTPARALPIKPPPRKLPSPADHTIPIGTIDEAVISELQA